MANSNVGVVLTLSAVNRATAVINQMVAASNKAMESLGKKSSALADKSFKNGTQMTAAAVAMGAPLGYAINSFADLEDAQLSLQSTMMNSSGRVSKYWGDINKLAIDLGNRLPGTTEDFYNLFQTMIENGGRAKDIINGTGKAAAYLGVQLKIPYTEAGELAQRLQVATGVANGDMLRFMDQLARVKQLGPSVQEMQMAFMRSAGELKTMKIQGVESVSSLSNVYAMLIRTMGSGERVGTGFSAILASMGDAKNMQKFNEAASQMGLSFRFMDKNGDFLGVENMMRQFDKMRNLTTNQKNTLISALVGAKGGDTQIVATLVNEGMAGYKKLEAAKNAQASLDQKVELRLKGVKQQWEAATGTFKNVAAAMGASLLPSINNVLGSINRLLPRVQGFIDKHPTLVNWVMKAGVGLTALAAGGAYANFVVGGLAKGVTAFSTVVRIGGTTVKAFQYALFAMQYATKFSVIPALATAGTAVRAFSTTLLTSPLAPFAAAAIAIAGAGYLIYRNWDSITAWWGRTWKAIKTGTGQAVDWIKDKLIYFVPGGIIYKHWDSISGYFKGKWASVKGVFSGGIAYVKNLGVEFYHAGVNILESIYKGMMGAAHKPVEAIQRVTHRIRQYLPFSPAKEGALRDIHQVKLVETIAGSIKPQPLMNAWDNALSQFKANVNVNGVLSGGGNGVGGGMAALAGAGGNVFHFKVENIIVQGGATADTGKQIARELEMKFKQMMLEYEMHKRRVGY